MAIKVKKLSTWKKQDVRYHFTDGTKLIHDSKKYYIGSKAPENEVDIDTLNFKKGNSVSYKFKDRGSEPSRYKATRKDGAVVYSSSNRTARPLGYGLWVEQNEWAVWNAKGVSVNEGGTSTTHTKSPERNEKFIKRESKLGRI